MNVENYEEFLDFIMEFLDKKFEDQKEYISCSKGCAKCCKTVSIPFSQLEFDYLMEGFKQLSQDKQEYVRNKIKQLIKNEIEPECPFLIDDVCSIYKYRGLICRTFGLLIVSEMNDNNIPFCIHEGLNYSKVYDEDTNTISPQKVLDGGYKVEPKFFPVNRTLLCNLNIVKDLELNFGKSQKLIEFLKDLPPDILE